MQREVEDTNSGSDRCGNRLLAVFRATRPFSFPVSFLPVVIGFAAVSPVSQWLCLLSLATLAIALLLHASGNLFNDYFDFISRVDTFRDEGSGRPGRMLVAGKVNPGFFLAEALACLAIALVPLTYIIWARDLWALAFFVPGALLLYAYTGPPFKLKYKALGELTIFVTFGPLMMGAAAWVQTGRLNPNVLLLSLSAGFLTAGMVAGNNARDYDEDREAGIKTSAQILGRRGGALLHVVLVMIGALVPAFLSVAQKAPWFLAFTPAALLFHLKPMQKLLDGKHVPDIDVRTARLEGLVFGYTLVCLIVSGGM